MDVALRLFTAADAPVHLRGEDEQTVRWLSGAPATEMTTAAWIERGLRVHAGEARGEYAFAVEVDGELAGMIAVNTALEAGMVTGDVNISYAVYPPFRGRGVAGAAIERVIEYVRERALGSAVVIRMAPENAASVRVAQKAGFIRDEQVARGDGDDLLVFRRQLGDSGGQMDGHTLARRYYQDAVAPLLLQRWPDVPHAAGRLGSGSDVLGLDDAMSRDHDWGLRLTLLVDEARVAEVDAHLAKELPETFLGMPTRFAFSGQAEPVHHVEVASPARFVSGRLGFDPREGVSVQDWLSVTGQAALEVVAGPVFHDRPGEITQIRRALEWYPDDVWRYVVATDWIRLTEEMPLMSRAGDAGDDLGSRVIAARLVDVAMHLAFTLSRRWMPYPKWRGTVLGRLPGMTGVHEHLAAVLRAGEWRERQTCLARALDLLLARQAAAGLPAPGPATEGFWDRPYLVAREKIGVELVAGIADPEVRAQPRGRGSVEQMSENVAVVTRSAERRALTNTDTHLAPGP